MAFRSAVNAFKLGLLGKAASATIPVLSHALHFFTSCEEIGAFEEEAARLARDMAAIADDIIVCWSTKGGGTMDEKLKKELKKLAATFADALSFVQESKRRGLLHQLATDQDYRKKLKSLEEEVKKASRRLQKWADETSITSYTRSAEQGQAKADSTTQSQSASTRASKATQGSSSNHLHLHPSATHRRTDSEPTSKTLYNASVLPAHPTENPRLQSTLRSAFARNISLVPTSPYPPSPHKQIGAEPARTKQYQAPKPPAKPIKEPQSQSTLGDARITNSPNVTPLQPSAAQRNITSAPIRNEHREVPKAITIPPEQPTAHSSLPSPPPSPLLRGRSLRSPSRDIPPQADSRRHSRANSALPPTIRAGVPPSPQAGFKRTARGRSKAHPPSLGDAQAPSTDQQRNSSNSALPPTIHAKPHPGYGPILSPQNQPDRHPGGRTTSLSRPTNTTYLQHRKHDLSESATIKPSYNQASPNTGLAEFIQEADRLGKAPQWTESSVGPPDKRIWTEVVSVDGRVKGTGSGTTKKEAKDKAAKMAMISLCWVVRSFSRSRG